LAITYAADMESIGSAVTKLTDKILGYTSDELANILKEIASEIGVSHIAHLSLASDRSEDVSVLTAVNTYSKEWGARYFLKKYSEIDPVFRFGVHALAPFDWSTLDRVDPAVQNFFADAIVHGVGRNGLTIPVRKRKNALSLVAFSSDLSEREWEVFKTQNMTNLQQLSALIDSAASIDRKLQHPPVQLSVREEQCLTWAARGKTQQEVAEILDLSLGSVKTHLDTARRKLHCKNLTHAVGVAVATGVIPAAVLGDRDSLR
jgi:DNA-binding CsgD family transcriptional regulator